MEPRRRRTDPDKIPWGFAWLVVITLLVEALTLLWVMGAFRPLSCTSCGWL